MGLESIWDEEGEWLTKNSKGFSARSTGCACCSTNLTSEQEVKKESICSLHWILRASIYFKWNIKEIIKEAKKELEKIK